MVHTDSMHTCLKYWVYGSTSSVSVILSYWGKNLRNIEQCSLTINFKRQCFCPDIWLKCQDFCMLVCQNLKPYNWSKWMGLVILLVLSLVLISLLFTSLARLTPGSTVQVYRDSCTVYLYSSIIGLSMCVPQVWTKIL